MGLLKINSVISLFFLFTCHVGIAYPSDAVVSEKEIKSRIEFILNQLPVDTKTGLIIINPLTEDTIISINPSESMIPASNNKLFTTAAALDLMDGDFLLSVKLLTEDDDLNDGVINGNLYLKGFGNSTFTSYNLDSLVEIISAQKISAVTGNIVGDDSYFDDVYTRDDWIKDEKANVELPPVSAIVIDRNRKSYTTVRRGKIRNYYRFVDDPPLDAARTLYEKLKSKKINIKGTFIKGVSPSNINLLAESSVQLRELIKLINKRSDNFMAECLFKTLGAEYSGKQGNSFFATQAIITFMKENGIFSEGTSIVDGSGISRFDKVTPGAISRLMERMYFDLKNFDDFYNSLSIAGVDGTLSDRLIGTCAENNFRGKTGTLNGVSSLSGYLTTKSGDDLIITIIFEFKRGGAKLHRDIQDKIITALCDYSI
ncbi:MAG: D-alanyl-D-alanine carboxypeptidase/D-alanyl-D-alanine-endopeptidase [Ignavibacteriaceae bacterium]